MSVSEGADNTAEKNNRKLHVGKPAWLKTAIPTGKTFFDIKKESKKGVRVYAGICEYMRVMGGGDPFKQDNITPRGLLFNISALQQCLKARWRIVIINELCA